MWEKALGLGRNPFQIPTQAKQLTGQLWASHCLPVQPPSQGCCENMDVEGREDRTLQTSALGSLEEEKEGGKTVESEQSCCRSSGCSHSPRMTFTLNRSRRSASSALKLHFTSSYRACGTHGHMEAWGSCYMGKQWVNGGHGGQQQRQKSARSHKGPSLSRLPNVTLRNKQF